MKNSVRIMALALLMSVVCWFAIGLVDADTQINIVNQCSQTISACQTDQSGQITSYALGSGANQLIDVGTSWPGGLIWGYPGGSADPTDCNTAKPQADLAEFTIGANNQDSYDLSNVNAYNLGLLINPTTIAPPGNRSGLECGTPSCTINNITSFCTPPNTLTPTPGDGCFNVNGTGTTPTSGTEAFDTACPEAISYSNDTTGKVYACPTGSNYEVVFCPENTILQMNKKNIAAEMRPVYPIKPNAMNA
ncbi:unnamed protein product [Sphagnum troendelagicum]|uniref:Thaumatin-like protein n=1 Tax=Sphagnum troendelagicum TaxID=128251 RepID=A0ABP0UHQ6_9BRYO